ncbi:hypothetical protein [Embleya scabrispora]|uniref:hypothetical protein n=1 Tax=Embleya scabrispora TaxID=159449 RepID=UPI00117CFFE8|nr:hypothetical protein [Embleya scabrispora]
MIPLRVPAGWNVIYNGVSARRLSDGRIEANDSEDLYWARTAPPPWRTAGEVAAMNGLETREINMDAGWYGGQGFRVVVLDPGWEQIRASHTTPDLHEFIATLEAWMSLITERGKLPES